MQGETFQAVCLFLAHLALCHVLYEDNWSRVKLSRETIGKLFFEATARNRSNELIQTQMAVVSLHTTDGFTRQYKLTRRHDCFLSAPIGTQHNTEMSCELYKCHLKKLEVKDWF